MLLIKPFSKFASNVFSTLTVVFMVIFSFFCQKQSGGYAGKQNADYYVCSFHCFYGFYRSCNRAELSYRVGMFFSRSLV